MTVLEEITRRALSVAEAGDLEALAKALAARAEAIAGGGMPTPEIVAMGERTLELLRDLIRSGWLESARLTQIQVGPIASLKATPNIDCRG